MVHYMRPTTTPRLAEKIQLKSPALSSRWHLASENDSCYGNQCAPFKFASCGSGQRPVLVNDSTPMSLAYASLFFALIK